MLCANEILGIIIHHYMWSLMYILATNHWFNWPISMKMEIGASQKGYLVLFNQTSWPYIGASSVSSFSKSEGGGWGCQMFSIVTFNISFR